MKKLDIAAFERAAAGWLLKRNGVPAFAGTTS
jgi:hypothetical protein